MNTTKMYLAESSKCYKPEYEITTENGGLLKTAKITEGGFCGELLHQAGNIEYYLAYRMDKDYRTYMAICDGNKRVVGRFETVFSKKCGYGIGYLYTHASFLEKEYNIYRVYRGKEGVYIPCYRRVSDEDDKRDGEQLGLVNRPSTTAARKGECVCFSDDEDCMQLLHLYCLFTDMLRVQDNDGVLANDSFYHYSSDKELIGKYNPEFISKAG